MRLLDTSVVVDIDRGGVDEKVARLDDEGRHTISAVTFTELRLGVNKQYERGTEAHTEALDALDRLCARFDIHPITRPVTVAAADIITALQRSGNALNDLHDVYIAATARTQQLPVLTANVSHFERVDDVPVVDWNAY